MRTPKDERQTLRIDARNVRTSEVLLLRLLPADRREFWILRNVVARAGSPLFAFSLSSRSGTDLWLSEEVRREPAIESVAWSILADNSLERKGGIGKLRRRSDELLW